MTNEWLYGAIKKLFIDRIIKIYRLKFQQMQALGKQLINIEMHF